MNEEQISNCLLAMQEALAFAPAPAFKEFWDAKKRCLQLFKENLTPRVRKTLWERYVALIAEVRHAKEAADIQADFAQEQIEAAIHDLEKQVLQEVEKEKQEAPLLEAFAGRILSLREELLKTPMRFRFKNRLLGQLARLGDIVFPLKKGQRQTDPLAKMRRLAAFGQRQLLKNELDLLRKQLSASGLDFEKAMFYRDLMEEGKQLLERMGEVS
jgi:hypothetical protein